MQRMCLGCPDKQRYNGFIDELIGDSFVNINPKREIYNVTFTFPVEAKGDLRRYIKDNGKKGIVSLILSEVGACQNAEHK